MTAARRSPRDAQPLVGPDIVVDIDGVLADCNGPMLAEICARYGYCFEIDDLTTYDALHQLLPVPDPATLLKEIFHRPGFLAQLPVRLDAIYAMRKLAGLCRHIHVVTARDITENQDRMAETRLWLERHGFIYHRLVFESDKVSYAMQHGCSYLVEDAPHHVEVALDQGIITFLVDAPYNRYLVPDNQRLFRVINLLEIPAVIEQIESLRRRQ